MIETWLYIVGLVSLSLPVVIVLVVMPRMHTRPSYKFHRYTFYGLMIGYAGLGRELLLRADNINTSLFEYAFTNSMLVLSPIVVVAGYIWVWTVAKKPNAQSTVDAG